MGSLMRGGTLKRSREIEVVRTIWLSMSCLCYVCVYVRSSGLSNIMIIRSYLYIMLSKHTQYIFVVVLYLSFPTPF